jgi:hypothetical protein
MFINTLPVRVTVDPALDPVRWLRGVQQKTTEAQLRHFTPLSLVERCAGVPAGARLFDSIVVSENFPQHRRDGAPERLRVTEEDSSVEEGYPLVLEIRPGRTIRLRVRYDAGRVAAVRAGGLVRALAAYAGAVPSSADGDVDRLRQEIAAELARSADNVRQQRRRHTAGLLRAARRQSADDAEERS